MSVYERAYTEREGSTFTEYPGFTVEFRESSHRYWLMADGKRTPAVSVTSALKVLDRPALLYWAERCGAEGAINLDRSGGIPEDEPLENVLQLVRSHGFGMDAKRDAGADRGTAIHNVLELYVTEGQIAKASEFDPSVRGYVQGLCRWLLATEPQPTAVEQIVGSVKHGYAGRLDFRGLVGERDLLVDLKTSPKARVYPEAHLQAAAYMLALEECGLAPVDGAMVLAVGEDGSFATADVCAEPQDWLAVLACHRTVSRVRIAVSAAERVAKAAA